MSTTIIFLIQYINISICSSESHICTREYSIQKYAICEYKPLCGVTPDKQEQDVSLTWWWVFECCLWRGCSRHTVRKGETCSNELQSAACTRFRREARGITETSHMDRDTATHLHFCVLFNFYILLIWLILLTKTCIYIRVLLVKRTRRRTDGKTFVNIIIRQHSRFSGSPRTLLRRPFPICFCIPHCHH